ncbi:MAG: hypothetical protein AB1659_09695 [Thermodesulfobacteriota bacterium]
MRRHALIGAAVVFMLGLSLIYAGVSNAGNSVSGSLSLNKTKIKLLHAYVDEDNPDSPIIALSDKPLPGKFSIGILEDKYIKKNKVHVLIFEISPKEKKLAAGGLGALYFPGKKTHYVAIADKLALVLDKCDESKMEGKISTQKPIVDDFYEITLSCEASFKVNWGKANVKAEPKKKP